MNKNDSKHFILKCQILWSFYMLWEGITNICKKFLNSISAPNKFLKCYWFEKEIKENRKEEAGGFLQKCSRPLPLARSRRRVDAGRRAPHRSQAPRPPQLASAHAPCLCSLCAAEESTRALSLSPMLPCPHFLRRGSSDGAGQIRPPHSSPAHDTLPHCS